MISHLSHMLYHKASYYETCCRECKKKKSIINLVRKVSSQKRSIHNKIKHVSIYTAGQN